MYLVAIAWMYVVLMMAAAEATSSTGSLLGALVTFVFYGVLPLSIVMEVMRAPDFFTPFARSSHSSRCTVI